MSPLKRVVISMVVSCLASSGLAATLPDPGSASEIEKYETLLGSDVDSFAAHIDDFLAGRRYYQEENRSYIGFKLTNNSAEYSKPHGDLKFLSRFVIPNTEKRLHLIAESDQQAFKNDILGALEMQNSPRTQDSTTHIGGRFSTEPKKTYHFNFDVGARWHDGPKGLAKSRLRYQRAIPTLRSSFVGVINANWFEQIGFSYTTNLRLQHKFTPVILGMVNNQTRWQEGTPGYELTQNLVTVQHLTSDKVISYIASVNGVTLPSLHATSYNLATSFSQTLRTANLGSTAGLEFPTARSFAGQAYVILQLSMTTH